MLISAKETLWAASCQAPTARAVTLGHHPQPGTSTSPGTAQRQGQPPADSCTSGRTLAGHTKHLERNPDTPTGSQRTSGWKDNFSFLKKGHIKFKYESAPYQDFILPNHPPKVSDSSGERTLGCNVCSRPIDTLEHSNQTWTRLCTAHQQK